jgi:general secretion pathway protein D
VRNNFRPLISIILAAGLASCVATPAKQDTVQKPTAGQTQQVDAKSVEQYSAALDDKTRKVQDKLAVAQRASEAGRLDEAEAALKAVLEIEPQNNRALDELTAISRMRRHPAMLAEAKMAWDGGDFRLAEQKVREVLMENPRNAPALSFYESLQQRKDNLKKSVPTLKSAGAPISFEFRDAPIKIVFQALKNATGINFILDRDIPSNLLVTLYIKSSPASEVLDSLLDANQLQKKIINDNTVQIYPNSPAKIKEYQEMEMRSFYLANAKVVMVANSLKTMLKINDMHVDERANLIIIRENPEVVKLAERMILALDIADPEVMLEMQLLDVNRNKLSNIGITYPTTLNLLTANGKSMTVDQLFNGTGLNRNSYALSPLPSATLSASDSDVNVIANPRIRVKNREKAHIHVGDRIPIFSSTTFNGTTTTTQQSVTYMDVGLKLEVVPSVNINDEVTIEVALEASTLGDKQTVGTSEAYQTSTRNANTILKLKDGETQILGGLIQDEDRLTNTKVPGLGDIPLLGRLFSKKDTTLRKSELLLVITPHVIRNSPTQSAQQADMMLGTETSMGRPSAADGKGASSAPAAPFIPPTLLPFVNPAAMAPKAAAPAAPASTPAAPAPAATPSTSAPPTGAPGLIN